LNVTSSDYMWSDLSPNPVQAAMFSSCPVNWSIKGATWAINRDQSDDLAINWTNPCYDLDD
jgi:hypothetical protein